MDAEAIEDAAAEVLSTFDRIITTFYDESEKTEGIVALDRQGNSRSFPVMTMSIGITTNAYRRVLALRRDDGGRLRDEGLREADEGGMLQGRQAPRPPRRRVETCAPALAASRALS